MEFLGDVEGLGCCFFFPLYFLSNQTEDNLAVDYWVSGNALHALRSRLSDPTNVLQSWDPTLVNPCTWFHVTCDSNNHVIRLYDFSSSSHFPFLVLFPFFFFFLYFEFQGLG